MKKLITLTVQTVIIITLLAICAQSAILPRIAALPHFKTWDHIGYQALVTDSGGNPIPDGFHGYTFKLHDHPTADSPVWTEAQTLETTDGVLQVHLGDAVPIPLDAIATLGQDSMRVLYLEVTVDGETISPRAELVATPYATVAARLLGDAETAPGRLLIRDPVSGDSIFTVGSTNPITRAQTVHLYLKSNGNAVAGMHSNNNSSGMTITNSTVSGNTQYVESVCDDLQSIVVLCSHDNTDSSKVEHSVATDSAGLSVRRKQGGLDFGINMSTTQTREHILLARQVGTANQSMELTVDSSGGEFEMSSTNVNGDNMLSKRIAKGASFADVTERRAAPGPTKSYGSLASVPLDSSKIETMMDDLVIQSTIFVNGDSAASTSASSDKRKQSLYFPETMLSAIELLVDGSASAIILTKINPTSGLPDTNFVADNNGNMFMLGKLKVSGDMGLVSDGLSLTVPRITTSQRDAMTPINGMIIYNITTNQFNFYENNAWVTR